LLQVTGRWLIAVLKNTPVELMKATRTQELGTTNQIVSYATILGIEDKLKLKK